MDPLPSLNVTLDAPEINLDFDAFFEAVFESIDWSIDDAIDSTVCVVLIVAGLFFMFFGCRIFRILILVFGGLLGFCVGYYLTMFFSLGDKSLGIVVGAIFGILLGSTVYFLFGTAIFLGGAACGVAIVFLFNSLFPGIIQPLILMIGILLSFGALGGFAALHWGETVIEIVASAVVGCLLFAIGTDHFAGNNISPINILQGKGCLGWPCFMLIGASLLLSTIGVLVQFKWVRPNRSITKWIGPFQKRCGPTWGKTKSSKLDGKLNQLLDIVKRLEHEQDEMLEQLDLPCRRGPQKPKAEDPVTPTKPSVRRPLSTSDANGNKFNRSILERFRNRHQRAQSQQRLLQSSEMSTLSPCSPGVLLVLGVQSMWALFINGLGYRWFNKNFNLYLKRFERF